MLGSEHLLLVSHSDRGEGSQSMSTRRCLACGNQFRLLPQVPEQNHCSSSACQRERRKLWQRLKRATDPAYRDNQARAQKAWLDRHPDYWSQYRERHPEYVERNRERQVARNTNRRESALIAKMDASQTQRALSSGTYRLSMLQDGQIAKMDEWIVQIVLLAKA
jgi:hypothetical protein